LQDDATPDRSPPSDTSLIPYPYTTDYYHHNNSHNSHKHSTKDEREMYTANEHSKFSPTHSRSTSPDPNNNNSDRKGRVYVNGKEYDCSGIRISAIVDEVRFVDCLEKNRQRLQLANVALTQGLITPEEYAFKQREFINAFTFFLNLHFIDFYLISTLYVIIFFL